MGTYLNPGNSGFAGIRNDKYVDKSEMISIINGTINTPRKLTCVSRPRRFGKSFAAKMLCAYYDKTCDSARLFADLAIAEDFSYLDHLNQYDVIYLDMTNILGKTKPENTISFITESITREIVHCYPGLSPGNAFDETLINTVEKTGNKFIVIIDEWDAPIREAPDIQKEYIEFLRMLFKGSGTTDRIVAAAYMTGILPIKKDGSQSAISDFEEFTMLKPRTFGKYVGFTAEEVQNLCAEYGVDYSGMRHWYDGYEFRKVGSVYNPNSVMKALRYHEFDSYWIQSSAAETLLTYIDMDEHGLQDDIARLISGEMIEVDPFTFKNDFSTFGSKDDVFTLMIHLGYLAYEEDINGTGFARIPNEEVRIEFHKILRKGTHAELIRLVQDSDKLLAQTIAMDTEAVAQAIEKTHDSITAPRFYNDEQALRSAIRMAYLSCVDQYMKIEELPSGHGYADIVYLPKRRSALPVLLIELKWNKTSKGALEQIRKKKYPAVLNQYRGDILLVGVNYDTGTKKHTCTIEKWSQ